MHINKEKSEQVKVWHPNKVSRIVVYCFLSPHHVFDDALKDDGVV